MQDDRYRRPIILAAIVGSVLGFSFVATSGDTIASRWYSKQQVEQGRTLYLTHCATCHGQQAEGTAEWRKTDSNGDYPPPPLNGTAHAWHHSLSVLERSIALGGVPNGGVMPGFAETLSSQDIQATIAFIQTFWSDEIYARWLEINGR